MSYATETLAIARTAYQDALTAQSQEFGDRSHTSQSIASLLNQVKYWEGQVEKENAASAGKSYRKPVVIIPS